MSGSLASIKNGAHLATIHKTIYPLLVSLAPRSQFLESRVDVDTVDSRITYAMQLAVGMLHVALPALQRCPCASERRLPASTTGAWDSKLGESPWSGQPPTMTDF